MGIHQIFAQNLRRKSEQFESIADACKHINVNRQQFNKYLSGAMLPNPRTLKRICEVFEIEDWELFVPPNSKISETENSMARSKPDLEFGRRDELTDALASIVGHFDSKPGIAPGYYNCYFPLLGFRGFVVRSSLLISKSKDRFNFVRHTRIVSPSDPKSTLAHGKHRGVVISNGTMDYLFGMNTVAPMNISFMAFPREATELKVGLAIIYGLNQHFACRTVVESLGQSAWQKRKLHSKHSIISTSSSDLNPVVAKIMDNLGHDVAGQLTMPDIEKLLINNVELVK
jgi:transcriptional regulator with XRE-family HTH domain